MKATLIQKGLLLLVALAWTESADAHGIAGNRYFAGTMTFDDPAVADEAIVPNFQYLGYPTQGSNVAENRINGSFARLLTPTLGITLDSGWLHQNWPIGHMSGFDKTNLGLKYEAYRDNKHETLVSFEPCLGHRSLRFHRYRSRRTKHDPAWLNLRQGVWRPSRLTLMASSVRRYRFDR